MTMDQDAWARLTEMSEVLLRLSDDTLRSAGQKDADMFWRCVEQQQQLTRDMLTIKAAQARRR